jgi:hypothetical protein
MAENTQPPAPTEKQVKLPANLSMENAKEYVADNKQARTFFQEVAEAGFFGDPNRCPSMLTNGLDIKGLQTAAKDSSNTQSKIAQEALTRVEEAFQRAAKKKAKQ